MEVLEFLIIETSIMDWKNIVVINIWFLQLENCIKAQNTGWTYNNYYAF